MSCFSYLFQILLNHYSRQDVYKINTLLKNSYCLQNLPVLVLFIMISALPDVVAKITQEESGNKFVIFMSPSHFI